MKQLIVLISTVILGIFIAGLVLGFRTDATEMNTLVSGQMDALIVDMGK